MRKILFITSLIFGIVWQSLSAQVTPNLDTNFQWLKDRITASSFSVDQRNRLQDVLLFAEKYAKDESTNHVVTQKLLEAFFREVLVATLESEESEEAQTMILVSLFGLAVNGCKRILFIMSSSI